MAWSLCMCLTLPPKASSAPFQGLLLFTAFQVRHLNAKTF